MAALFRKTCRPSLCFCAQRGAKEKVVLRSTNNSDGQRSHENAVAAVDFARWLDTVCVIAGVGQGVARGAVDSVWVS